MQSEQASNVSNVLVPLDHNIFNYTISLDLVAIQMKKQQLMTDFSKQPEKLSDAARNPC